MGYGGVNSFGKLDLLKLDLLKLPIELPRVCPRGGKQTQRAGHGCPEV